MSWPIIKIHDLARGGSGVGKLDNGAAVFVPFTAPGDEIEIKNLKNNKRYSEAEVGRIAETSSLRVKAQCPVFEKCGGCTWQHLNYPLQFETKKKGLLHALKRAEVETAHVPIDDLPADQGYHYRNRIQLHGDPQKKEIGFFARKENTIVPIQNCPIARPEINRELLRLAEIGFQKFNEVFKLEIEVQNDGKVQYAFNQTHAAFGFRQVNDEQNEKLKAWISKNIIPAPLLLDLYGGHGNLSIPLVESFQEIQCIDLSVPQAKGPAPHYRYIKSSARNWARDQKKQKQVHKEASIILDPPRAGIGSDFAELESGISRHHVRSLMLVGCDVDSFVRDARHFIQKGYRLSRLGVLDLFPQTPHVESLALFFK